MNSLGLPETFRFRHIQRHRHCHCQCHPAVDYRQARAL